MAEHHTPISAEELAHAFEEETPPVDLSVYAIEDWVTLAFFWGMALCVFLQFFTRYVLNNSLAWTEEIATNCLVIVVFLGSVWCVRKTRHIHVDVLYHYMSLGLARFLAVIVDIVRVVFLVYATWLTWRYVQIVQDERMVTVDLPRGFVFYAVLIAFALMSARAVQVAVANWRRGYSVLERPSAFDGSEA